MAIEIVMPRLGWNMEAGTVVEWLKRDGDRVEPGEYLFLVEGDKSTTEVEALDGGTLRIPENNLRVGEELPVGTLLAYLVQDDEVLPASSPAPTTAVASGVSRRDRDCDNVVCADRRPGPIRAGGRADGDRARRRRAPVASPRARRVAAQLGVDWTALSGSSRSGRIRRGRCSRGGTGWRDHRHARRDEPAAIASAAARAGGRRGRRFARSLPADSPGRTAGRHPPPDRGADGDERAHRRRRHPDDRCRRHRARGGARRTRGGVGGQRVAGADLQRFLRPPRRARPARLPRSQRRADRCGDRAARRRPYRAGGRYAARPARAGPARCRDAPVAGVWPPTRRGWSPRRARGGSIRRRRRAAPSRSPILVPTRSMRSRRSSIRPSARSWGSGGSPPARSSSMRRPGRSASARWWR